MIGNILGYTVFKDVCAAMYYGSYSLPTYVTVWNAEAFLLTTVVPVIIMLVVNYVVLQTQTATVSSEIPAQGSFVGKQTEESCPFKSEDQNIFQIPSAGHFPEHEQLYCAVYWNHLC